MEPTDEELMNSVSRGNLSEMGVLFERYHKWIYNFFYQRIGSEYVCKDLTQNVFMRAIQYRSSYKGGKFVSWIFSIARNICFNFFEQNKSIYNNMDVELLENKIEVDEILKNENLDHMKIILKRLNPKERELIQMARFENMNYKSIAAITNSTEGAIKVKIHRIIKKLQSLYFKTI